MMSLLVLLLILGSLFFIYRKFTYWNRRNIKQLPIILLVKNIVNVVLRKTPLYEINKRFYLQCKLHNAKFRGFYLFFKPVLFVRDLDLIKRILISDFDSFTDRVFYIKKSVDPLSGNLLGLKGSEWKSMREKLSPAYTPNKLKMLFQVLESVGDHLKVVLDEAATNSEVVNFQDISSRFVVDAIVMCIYGVECNTLQNFNKEFEYHAKKVLGGSTIQNLKMILSVLFPSILETLNVPFNSKEIQDFYISMTKQTVEYREKNGVVRKDLMHSLIQMRNNVDINREDDDEKLKDFQKSDSKSLTVEEIAAQIMVFFAAGYETSSTVITFSVYELMCNEDIQDRLRREVNDVLKSHDDKLSYQALTDMTYMDMCLYETMRKYTIVQGIIRVCTKPYKIPDEDAILEVGSELIIPVGEIHQDPTYYPEPKKFDPERFSPENKLKLHNLAFLGFSHGPRYCIGTRLAMLKIKLFLAILLKNYTFSPNSRTKLPLTLHRSNAILIFKDTLYMNIEKISG